MSVPCPVCQHDNRDTARCCTACGAPLGRACPQCDARNTAGARFCVQCGQALQEPPAVTPTTPSAPVPASEQGAEPTLQGALSPPSASAASTTPPGAAAPMEFVFDTDAPPFLPPSDARDTSNAAEKPPRRGVWVVGAVVAVAGAAAWYGLARPGVAPAPASPPTLADAMPPSAPPASDPLETPTAPRAAQPASEPLEEFIEPERPGATAADPGRAPPPPVAEAPFTPVTVPRVPDAAAPPRTTAKAPPPEDAPWPPVARPAQPPGDGLAALRGALAQCAAMGNELSRSNCLARTRQNFCGNAWGRIPECPQGQ